MIDLVETLLPNLPDNLSWVKGAAAIIYYIDGTKEIMNLKYKYGE